MSIFPSLTLFKTLLTYACLLNLLSQLSATPSSEWWTNATTAVQPCGTYNLGLIDYFTVFNRKGHGSSLPTDVGLEIGVLSWKKINVEAGFDYLAPLDYPLFFNGKFGVGEDFFFKGGPSMSFGIFGVGTHKTTNFNVLNLVFGHTLPEAIGGNVYIAFYHGNHSMGKNRNGIMVAADRSFIDAVDCEGKEYKKWRLIVDYATGRNFIGGGGIGISYYFTPDINALTGPVWFNDASFNRQWKWSAQAYANF